MEVAIKQNEQTESPFALFSKWFDEARTSPVKDPFSVFLATASASGAPSCRVVLLKEYSEAGFVIYTNLQSRKGREVTKNPQAALCFYWRELGKQVRIEGHVTTVTPDEADAYFASRPLKSRIGAWASNQSQPMENRNELLKRVAYFTAKWATGTIKRPPHWSGIRIIPHYFEFWKEADMGIPERQIFNLSSKEWTTGLLQP